MRRRIVLVVFPFASPVVARLAADMESLLGRLGEVTTVAHGLEPDPRTTRSTLRIRAHRAGGRGARRAWSRVGWALTYPVIQAELAYRTMRASAPRDVVAFFLGPHYVVPAAVARAFGRRVLFIPGGSAAEAAAFEYGGAVARLVRALERSVVRVAHVTALESKAELARFPHRGKVLPLAARAVGLPDARTVLSPQDRPRSALYLGRLEPRKGILDALEAARSVDCELVVAGQGSLATEVERAAKTDPRVRYVGWVDDARLPGLLARARFLLVPSKSEGLPTVALEAMAHGAVVIATPVGGLPDIVRDGETGFLARAPDKASIVEAWRRALDSPDLAKIAEAARQRVEAEYSATAATARYERLLEEVE